MFLLIVITLDVIIDFILDFLKFTDKLLDISLIISLSDIIPDNSILSFSTGRAPILFVVNNFIALYVVLFSFMETKFLVSS